MDIKIKLTSQLQNNSKKIVFTAIYNEKVDLQLNYENRLTLNIKYEELHRILDKVMNIPGLSDENLIENILEYGKASEYFQMEMENPLFINNIRLIFYIAFILDFNHEPNGKNIYYLNKFLKNNFQVVYIGKYDEPLPIIYFLSDNEFSNENSKFLFEKSFLHEIQISYINEEGNESTFTNYFKPIITPLARIHLNGSNLVFFNNILRNLDNLLKKFN